MTFSLPFKLDLGGNDNAKGVTLALSSGLFIGASFIIKKKGLQAAGNSGGQRAADGGFAYLREPLWWLGLITMIGGEAANFAAYAYAPAIVVTPLGATTIIVTALLAWCMLGERLHECGILGCLMCVLGSVVLVSFAPEEGELHSMEEIWALATQPQFLTYCAVVVALSVLISFRCGRYGETNVLVYISICSLMGSLSVVSCKALGIALKLTFKGHNQLGKSPTYVFVGAVAVCVATQMNYLNKALDTFNTALVSSVYYVFFTVSHHGVDDHVQGLGEPAGARDRRAARLAPRAHARRLRAAGDEGHEAGVRRRPHRHPRRLRRVDEGGRRVRPPAARLQTRRRGRHRGAAARRRRRRVRRLVVRERCRLEQAHYVAIEFGQKPQPPSPP